MPSPTEITVSQLSRLIGTQSVPVIIDTCIDEDFDADSRLIPTAFRHPHTDIAALVPKFEGKRVVVYCHKGKKISQGAAAILRTHGVAAESLEGGIVAWRDAGELLVPATKIPAPNAQGQSVWVTRHRPKIDRMACPWLVRRFIDPRAQFLFVAPSEVLMVAEKFNATPFDIEDVFWSHRGDYCTFDTMLEEFELQTKALKKLAVIVRGADTNRHDLAPEAAGYSPRRWVCHVCIAMILNRSMQACCFTMRFIVGHVTQVVKATIGRNRIPGVKPWKLLLWKPTELVGKCLHSWRR